MRRVLVTGSREWADHDSVTWALDAELRMHGAMTVVHGDCPTGADAIAAAWAREAGSRGSRVTAEPHPADWGRHGKAAGPIRNQQMVDLGADVCLAFPLGRSPGTRHCMRAAKKAGIPVIDYAERDQ